MAATCQICAGPIDPPDLHQFCVTCLGLAHAEAALTDDTCAHCAELPVRALRARREVARATAGMRPTAASEPLVGPPPPEVEFDDVNFAEVSFRPPNAVANFVTFEEAGEEDDSMSLSASEKDWGSQSDRPDQEGPADLQEELVRVLSKAVTELDLAWNAPDEPVKSKLDSWFLQSSRRQAAPRRRTPFFPDVHEHVVKSWAAPQSARTHSATQAMFAHVDGAEAHGYVRMPPVEETVAAHLCPSSSALGSDRSLPSKPCRFTAHQADKAYAAAGEAVSALHAMAILQVFQAKLLQSLDGGAVGADVIRDLRAATDLALMATKRSAQAIGRSMGFMVVLNRHLWLTLADLKDADRKTLLNAPVTPSGLFGDAVESVTERFSETQKRAKAMSHVMPRRSLQSPSARSRSSSAPRQAQGPARQPAVAPRPEPDARFGRSKQWSGPGRKRQGQRRSPRRERASAPSPATKPSS